MAIIPCPECKSDISDQAPACPKCGFPLQSDAAATNDHQGQRGRLRATEVSRGSWWFWCLLALTPLIVIGAIYIRNKAVGPAGWAKENTERSLRERMKDPDSMLIRNSYVVRRQDGHGVEMIYFCGFVNGKNSFGGYGETMRFASWSNSTKDTFDTVTVQLSDPDAERDAKKHGQLSPFVKVYWNDWCVDAAHPPVIAARL